ncbi:hypothetical protein WJX82_011388 [Trebouxia sp. C0006]
MQPSSALPLQLLRRGHTNDGWFLFGDILLLLRRHPKKADVLRIRRRMSSMHHPDKVQGKELRDESTRSTYTKAWHHLGAGFALWQGLDPGFLFLLLAPPKLFHATGSLPKTYLSQSAWHITLLAIVGVGAGAVMTAVIMKYVFPYGWSWPQSFMFGAIVAATDPVAAVSLLKQVHASEELTTVIDGEPLVDDGIAAVLYAIFLKSVQGSSESASDVQDPVTVCWEVIEYFANTLIFVISGVIIAGRIYAGHQDSSPHILTGMDYAWAVALWLLLLVVRGGLLEFVLCAMPLLHGNQNLLNYHFPGRRL